MEIHSRIEKLFRGWKQNIRNCRNYLIQSFELMNLDLCTEPGHNRGFKDYNTSTLGLRSDCDSYLHREATFVA